MRTTPTFLISSLAALASACGPGSGGGECSGLVAGDLVITEVFPDAPGTDEGREWFEIFNSSDRAIDLDGVTITYSKIDGESPKSHKMAAATIAPGQYFTLGNASADLLPPYIDYGYANGLGDMGNTNGRLKVACGSTTVDEAPYDMVKGGASRQLTAAVPPDYTLNDDVANWCEAKDTEFETGSFGTPGSDNDCAPIIAGTCMEGGVPRAAVPPQPGELVITEIMPATKAVSATVGQWFEVMATVPLDINGIGLDRANDMSNPKVISSADCIHLDAGEYAVFAREADVALNGGVQNLGTFPFSLNPSQNKDVQIVYGDVVIDAVSWTTQRTGYSLSLNPEALTSTANDDPANFCDSTNAYNTVGTNIDYGTPGAANTGCPRVIPAGSCDDNGTVRPIVKPPAGQLVISEALANPAGTGTDATQEWFEIANVGTTAFDLNGLTTKGASSASTTITSAECKSVPGNGYAVLARSADPAINMGLPEVAATFSWALSTRIEILDGTASLDVVTLSGVADGRSSMVRPDKLTVTDNDVAANFCLASVAQKYGTADNAGTPGEANSCP